MSDRRHLLKIKLKSLAAEARIIRKAENRLQIPAMVAGDTPALTKEEREKNPELSKSIAKQARIARNWHRAQFRSKPWYGENRARLEELQLHRVRDVRESARATHLAYGFIRGRTYAQMEGLRYFAKNLQGEINLGDTRVLGAVARMIRFYGPGLDAKDSADLLKRWIENRNTKLYSTGDPKVFTVLDARYETLETLARPDSDGTALAAPSTP